MGNVGTYMSYFHFAGFGELGSSGQRPGGSPFGFYVQMRMAGDWISDNDARANRPNTVDPITGFIDSLYNIGTGAFLADAQYNSQVGKLQGYNAGKIWEANLMNSIIKPGLIAGGILGNMAAGSLGDWALAKDAQRSAATNELANVLRLAGTRRKDDEPIYKATPLVAGTPVDDYIKNLAQQHGVDANSLLAAMLEANGVSNLTELQQRINAGGEMVEINGLGWTYGMQMDKYGGFYKPPIQRTDEQIYNDIMSRNYCTPDDDMMAYNRHQVRLDNAPNDINAKIGPRKLSKWDSIGLGMEWTKQNGSWSEKFMNTPGHLAYLALDSLLVSPARGLVSIFDKTYARPSSAYLNPLHEADSRTLDTMAMVGTGVYGLAKGSIAVCWRYGPRQQFS